MHPPIFAHLHSSPLVVRRRTGIHGRSFCSSVAHEDSLSGLDPVEIIDVKAERRLLLETLRESGRRLAWHSEVADLHAFQRVLSFGCRVLHFSGHGVPGQVIFETRKGEAQFLSQQDLQNLLRAGGAAPCRRVRPQRDKKTVRQASQSPFSFTCKDHSSSCSSPRSSSSSDDGPATQSHWVPNGWVAVSSRDDAVKPSLSLQLVFVSACHSESVAHAFVSAGVPHVVAVSKEEKVVDRQAMAFAKAFYTALFAGQSVATSFQIGRVQAEIAVACTGSGGKPSEFKLLGQGDHANALFQDVPHGQCVEPERRGKGARNECDAVAEKFVGRSFEVYHVYKSLVEGARLVSITGARGIGKTEVALQCAQYATERRVFRRIFYLRLTLGNDAADDVGEVDFDALVNKFAQCLGLEATSLDELIQRARQQCEVETCGDANSFLLLVDGWDQVQRQKASLYAIVTMLLRRVSSLSILLTGESRFRAVDGVGEKIVSVGPLPPTDAALLFTLRAPRKIKVHEMGGSMDLEAFGKHHIMKQLRGHPRTICAVSQFLECKDLELDQHEFLSCIIPSVNAGLKSDTILSTECGKGGRCKATLRTVSNVSTLVETRIGEECTLYSSKQPDRLLHSVETKECHQRPSAYETASRPMEPVASHSDGVTNLSSLTLPSTQSESILTDSIASSTTSHKQQCLLMIANHVRPLIQSEGGSLVWARAVVLNAKCSGWLPSKGGNTRDNSITSIRRLQDMNDIPLDWIAPQISCFFATKLGKAAAHRPLSARSFAFMSQSPFIWGCNSLAPAQRGGAVTLCMFTAFWTWFRSLVECISWSFLWPHTEPRLLHGFLSKEACASMFKLAPPGTFLLRFSETRVRCLVIAYVHDDRNVQFVPVTWQPDHHKWLIALQRDATASDVDNNKMAFPTLHALIRSVNVLKFLFPHIPKETAFEL